VARNVRRTLPIAASGAANTLDQDVEDDGWFKRIATVSDGGIAQGYLLHQLTRKCVCVAILGFAHE
jgi:hypothetical protein